ncbi:MAG: nuclear transport factor 2 family protein [Ginsengibacter sp.]
MNSNQELIAGFYQAFQNKDYKTMQDCYAEDATFNDEVFLNLTADEVRAMWEMLIKKGKDLQLVFSNIRADEQNGSADWIATYSFSKTNSKVTNHIHANFTFKEGKIFTHTDTFGFYKWASQAFGTIGVLLGWTPFFKNKVRKEAMNNLAKFIRRN